jgi:hypothetical protein
MKIREQARSYCARVSATGGKVSKQLENKVAIISGAASGIERACAHLFAARGARVVVADVNAAGPKRWPGTWPPPSPNKASA